MLEELIKLLCMKMVNIMNYKLILYIISVLLSTYTLSSINFNNFFKKNKVIESRIFILMLSFIMGYLLTNFIVDFIEVSSIL